MFKGELVHIRKMVAEDAPVVLEWENDPANWLISEGEGPYVIEDILDLVTTCENIGVSKQTRYIIVRNEDNKALGTIDLFNICFEGHIAGVGILVADEEDRRKGYGRECLRLIESLALEMEIERLIAVVHQVNAASKKLFAISGYDLVRTEMDLQAKDPDYIEKVVFEKCLKNY